MNGLIIPPSDASGETISLTQAQLAALNPTPAAGQLVVARTPGGGRWAVGDGETPWLDLPQVQRPPMELAHADSDTPMAGITTEVDITDLASLSFTVTDYPVYVVLFVSILSNVHVSAGCTVTLRISDGANVAKRVTFKSLAAGFSQPLTCVERIVTPGDYVRKGRVQRSGGTLNLGLNEFTPTEFYATEMPVLIPAD